jgi:parvulin-like peptidyl-prolyl isomerase
MSQAITISAQDILQQVKLSCQVPSIVEQIVTRKVVKDAAAEAGIKVETEELQQAADQIRLISKLKTADETWEWLKKNCLSLDDFEDMVYTNVISGKLAQHLFGDKVEPWFVEHQLDYAGAVIYEVVLDDEDLAMELFYALQEGEISFFEIAQQYIQDTELRRRGGYRGVVRRNEMKPEISAAVFAGKPPQVLKPIVTAKGVHLILVEEVVKPQLDNKLHYQFLSNFFTEWIKQKIEEVDVVTDLELSRLTC